MAKFVEETTERDNGLGKVKHTKVVQDDNTYIESSDLMLAKAYQVIWFILALIEILIGFRVVLKILGASSFSPFASFIYTLSSAFVSPFFGILGASFGPNGSVIEWSSVLAGIVYAVIAWIIVYLIQVLHHPHVNHVNEEEIVD